MAGTECGTTTDHHVRQLADALAEVDVSGLDETALLATLSCVRTAQRVLDGVVARLAARADVLASTGSAAPATETLRGAGTVGANQARTEARRATTAAAFPAAGRALNRGEISAAHVDVLASLTANLDDDQLAKLDGDALATEAGRLPVETFRRLVRRTIDALTGDHGLDETLKQQQQTKLRWGVNPKTGVGWLSGEFCPETHEKLINAVEAQMDRLCASSTEPLNKDATLAGAALIDLITGPRSDSGSGSGRPSIIVVADADTMAGRSPDTAIRQTETGRDVAPETIARLACDATLRRVTLDEGGVPINVGRQYRTATSGQWAAIKALHTSCAWDGCDAPISWCQLHHIHEWEHGGPTDLDNLIPLCSRHHHRVHEGRWSIKMLPDRSVDIFKPDGTHHATAAPPTRRSPRPSTVMRC
jgi:hypothetical protein